MNDAVLRKFGITSKKAATQYQRALKLWTEHDVQKVILLLTECDFSIRKSGQALQSSLIEITLLKIIKKQLSIVSIE